MPKLTDAQRESLEYAARPQGGWPRAKARKHSWVIRSYRALERRGLVVEVVEDAPEMYQRLSANGGDEDWIVVYPEGEDENTMWEIDMKVVERLAVCDYAMHTAEDGRRIAITCHA